MNELNSLCVKKKKRRAVFCACNQNKTVFPRYETYLLYNEYEIILITFAPCCSFFLVCNSALQRTGSAKQMYKSSHLWSVNTVATGEISVILLKLIKHIRSKHWNSTNRNCLSTFKGTSSNLTTRADVNAYASLLAACRFELAAVTQVRDERENYSNTACMATTGLLNRVWTLISVSQTLCFCITLRV